MTTRELVDPRVLARLLVASQRRFEEAERSREAFRRAVLRPSPRAPEETS